MLCTTGI